LSAWIQGQDFDPLAHFSDVLKPPFCFRNKKRQKRKRWVGKAAAGTLRKPERRGGKSHAMAAFRVISKGQLAAANFSGIASIFAIR
jgi:hypothetical protein